MRKACIVLLLLLNSSFEVVINADNKQWKNKKAEEANAKKTIQKLYPLCCQRYHELLNVGLSQNESLESILKTNAGREISNIEAKGLLVAYFFPDNNV